jgi:hypothetical protein
VRVTRAPGLTVHASQPDQATWEVRHEAIGQMVVHTCRTLQEAIAAARKLADGIDWCRSADELVEDAPARARAIQVQMWVHTQPKRRDEAVS